jgi:hypothetical protein
VGELDVNNTLLSNFILNMADRFKLDHYLSGGRVVEHCKHGAGSIKSSNLLVI